MTQRRIVFFSLLLMAVGMMAQTHLKIVPLSDAEQQMAIAQIGKIIFADDKMCLYDNSGTLLGSTSVAQIDKIVFVDNNNATSYDEAGVINLQIYPNPTQESLSVRGLQDGQVVRIYSLQGQLLQSAAVTDGVAQLYVGGLQNGTYLLQAGAQAVKIIKN